MATVPVSLAPTEYGTDQDVAALSRLSFITAVHPDIILTHILTRLDGATLATTASTSSHLRLLCADEDLWQKICAATWPSLTDPTTSHVISTFPAGHRSIFYDAFPSLHHNSPSDPYRLPPPPPPPELISAVDIYYNGEPMFSRVHRTETEKNWFLTSPFCVEMLEPDGMVPTPVRFSLIFEEWARHMEESLRLSWVVIDPTLKRAANVSSRRPVWVRRHWLTRDLEAAFAIVMEAEEVRCWVKVTWCGKFGRKVYVRKVKMEMEDAEGGHVRGEEAVGILQRAMESGVRKRVVVDGGGCGVEAVMKSYEKFSCMVKERRKRKHRRQEMMDVASTLLAFAVFLLFCFLIYSTNNLLTYDEHVSGCIA
ncbi:F-box protein At2g27310-like [Lotus japonicus]|uniref:F-box protein At2g27310-like n=1 Tax=Lotus japonicus TaxID=34305 RepID=UPI00258A8F1C|nr:F-box protein At2g27310-like [Lotus japonicus]